MSERLETVVLFRVMRSGDHDACFDIVVVAGRERKHIWGYESDVDDRRSGETCSTSECRLKFYRRESRIVSESDPSRASDFHESISETIEEICIDIDSVDTTKVIWAREDRVVHKYNSNLNYLIECKIISIWVF